MANISENLNDFTELKEVLPQNFYDVKEDGYYFCGDKGSYVLKIDKEGKIHIINKSPSLFTDTQNNGFSIIDRLGNVVFKIDEKGYTEFKITREFATKLRAIFRQL